MRRLTFNIIHPHTRWWWQIFFFFLLTFLPTNLFLVLSEKFAFINGLKIDYLILKLYFSQCLIWVGALSIISAQFNQHPLNHKVSLTKKPISISIMGFCILLFSLFSSSQLPISLWFALQVATGFIFLWLLEKHESFVRSKRFFLLIYFSYFVQTLLAIYQFIQQKSLLPYFVFGEPHFDPYFSLARHLFDGKEKILAYGSTAHPNVLAGIMVIFFLIMFNITLADNLKKNLRKLILAFFVTLLILFITQSVSALLTLIVGLCIITCQHQNTHIIKKKLKTVSALVFAIIIVISPLIVNQQAQQHVHDTSLTRRNWLNQAAWMMFLEKPLTGVGLNQFVIHLEKFSNSNEIVRFVQPVHHVGLLWLAETGLLGVAWLGCLVSNLSPSKRTALLKTVLILSPILVLDHYLYSLLPGNLAFFLMLNQLETKTKKLETQHRSW